MKIYTRTGDAGDTSLFDGTRVKKDDPRVDAYGEVDELNAWLGLARASSLPSELDEALVRIQRDLFALGATLADPAEKIADRVTKAALGDDDVERLERLIDRLEAELPPLRRLILAGGSLAGAALLSRGRCAGARTGRCRSSPASTGYCCATSTGCPTCCSSSLAPSTTARRPETE